MILKSLNHPDKRETIFLNQVKNITYYTRSTPTKNSKGYRNTYHIGFFYEGSSAETTGWIFHDKEEMNLEYERLMKLIGVIDLDKVCI